MKKILAVILSTALLLTTLGGCGKNGKTVKLDPKNPVSINIWHYYNGAQKNAFDELIKEFNETLGVEQGIVVEAVNQGDVTQLTQSIIDSANNKVGTEPIPNVFAGYADTALQIDKLGLVADLEEYLTEEEINAYFPSYIQEGRLGAGDALKIFPTAKTTEIFMLNKTDWDKFAKATGASLDKLKSIEGLVEVSKQYYEWTDGLTPDVKNDGKAFFGRDAMANYMIIGCRQLGQEIFSVSGDQVKFQTDKTVLRKLWDNYYVPYINGYFTANGKFRSDDAKVGDIIALVGSSTTATYFPQEVANADGTSYPIETLVMEAPTFASGEKYAVQQGAGMVVTKSTPEKEYASTVFLKWFTEAERNLSFSISSGYLPVKIEANTNDKLEAAMQKMEETGVSTSLKESLRISMQTVNSSKLYTNRAFVGGTKARSVLEYALSDQAKADKAEIDKLIKAGKSREDAVSRYNTDQNFDKWYASLQQKLRDSIVTASDATSKDEASSPSKKSVSSTDSHVSAANADDKTSAGSAVSGK